MLHRLLYIFIGVATTLPIFAQDNCDGSKASVVKIRAAGKTGAGFVISATNSRVYILTAYHVVEGIDHPDVYFCGDRTFAFPAEQVPDHSDEDKLDAAFLVVSPKDNHSLPTNIHTLVRIQLDLREGEKVTTIGHPGDDEWKAVRNFNVITKLISDSDPARFQFTRSGIDDGNSGGPVLDENDNLIGLVLRTKPHNGDAVAVRIDSVLGFIADRQIPADSLQVIPNKPKLALVISVGQLSYELLSRFRREYEGGFAQLLDRGAIFTNAYHDHFPSTTASGLSVVMTGADPSFSGIIGNEWFERESNRSVTSVSDESVRDLVLMDRRTPSSSPHRLMVDTVGDQIKMADPGGKVIGIALRDRGAILLPGAAADLAIWFDDDSGLFTSSSYYTKSLPDWLQAINAKRPTSKYLGAAWMPVDAKVGDKPFCSLVAGTEIPFCGSLVATPFGNEMVEDLAEAAIASEHLGSHGSTDLLCIDLISNDYVGHAYGPDSPQVRDMILRTDAILNRLFEYLQRSIGMQNVLVVLTAEHGVAPIPEIQTSRKLPGGRIDGTELSELVGSVLDQHFGHSDWILADLPNVIYLNYAALRKQDLDVANIERMVAGILRGIPHIFRVYTRTEIIANQVTPDYVTRRVVNGFFPSRSGNIIYVADPNYVIGSISAGTSEGSPFNYDTHVPICFLGAAIRPGLYGSPVLINDIAPTVAALVGVPPPFGSTGRVLSEAILRLPEVKKKVGDTSTRVEERNHLGVTSH